MSTNIAQTWRPNHVWLFAGSTFLFSQLFAAGLFALVYGFPSSAGFLRTSFAQATLFILGLFVIFGFSLVFAKVKSLNEFVSSFGLTRPSESEILVAVAIGLLIQYVGIFVANGNFSHLQLARSFKPAAAAVHLAPFFEEPAMRGFAFKAFRNSYPVAVSICFVTAISLVFHLGQIYHSLHNCIVLAIFNIALCLLREKHSSLWSCIACHFAFNFVYAGMDR